MSSNRTQTRETVSGRRPPVPVPSRTLSEIWRDSATFRGLSTSSEIGRLAARTGQCLIRPPFNWLWTAVEETNRFIARCAIPLTVSIFFWVLGYAFVMLLGFIRLLGAADRLPGTLLLGFTREPIVWVTGMVFAGTVGASITADLAARKNREELDALTVLGVDQIRLLVVPRVVAAAVACTVLGIFAIFVTILTDWSLAPSFTPLSHRLVADGIVQSMLSADQIAALLKFVLIGAFVGLVSCAKGLSAEGGTEGVGRAVNQNIVLLFAGIWVLNSLFNLTYLTVFPQLADFKG
jgi:phospholipid/cholesterol/gamma-HCH transport system permease protein